MMLRKLLQSLLTLMLVLLVSVPAWSLEPAKLAPDATKLGPYPVKTGFYRLPQRIDATIAPGVVTEIWARIYRPATITGPRPLLVFLHGNHGTCGRKEPGIPGRADWSVDYTTTGKCPPGYVVTPNHEGYAYVAERLASHGYIVVSINANRSINGDWGDQFDSGLNLRRGRLVLRHLTLLDEWSRLGTAPASVGFNMKGAIDFNHVGLMGHSRGGEGMLAAIAQYRDKDSPWPKRFKQQPWFRAVFAIAPVDGQTARVFSAADVAYGVLIPMCDGDVSTIDGIRVFDRASFPLKEKVPAMKAIFAVWGTNHNFFNTEWQQSDSQGGCTGGGNKQLFGDLAVGSALQRQTAVHAMMAFLRAHVGVDANPDFARLFDPRYQLPRALKLLTTVERTFNDNALRRDVAVIDEFNGKKGYSSSGLLNSWKGVTFHYQTLADHFEDLRAAAITWTRKAGEPAPYFQSNGWMRGGGQLAESMDKLEFRVSLACQDQYEGPSEFGGPDVFNCFNPLPINGTGKVTFGVALATSRGTTAPLPLANYLTLLNPVGIGPSWFFFSHQTPIAESDIGFPKSLHPIMQSVRIPLRHFNLAPGTKIHGVRLVFDQTQKGSIFVTSIRLTRPSPVDAPAVKPAPYDAAAVLTPVPLSRPAATAPEAPVAGSVVALRLSPGGGAAADAVASAYEIELAAAAPLRVRDQMMVLQIGNRQFLAGRYSDRKTLRRLAFTLPKADYDRLASGAAITLITGRERMGFGKLDKTKLTSP